MRRTSSKAQTRGVTPMEVSIALSNGSAAEVDDLESWLQAEQPLRGTLRRSADPASPDHMGALAEAIVVALGSGGAVSVLSASVPVWLRHQRSDLHVKITRGDRTISLDSTNLREADEIIREILRDENP